MEQLLRLEAAADILAIKPSTLRTWVARRKIAVVRPGGRAVRIARSEVERLIAEATTPDRRGR
jgi:excisionase family DNA binding protein